MKGRKARFGISLPEELARKLDTLSSLLGTDRSTLVAEALAEFLHEKSHVLEPHICEGMFMVAYRFEERERITEVLKAYDSVIVTRIHVHSKEGYCVELAYARGPSEEITALERDLRKANAVNVRYLVCEVGR